MPYKDPEKQKAAVEKWQRENRQQMKDRKADWFQENKEDRAQKLREWRRKNFKDNAEEEISKMMNSFAKEKNERS